jgi:hypothetical protein
LSTSVVNGKIYAIGGWCDGAFHSTVEEYDPATDTWTKKADMPTARQWLSTSVVDGKIYAIGGKTLSTVEEYDPATDTWMKKADMPTARLGLSTSVVNGRIYAIGASGGSVVEEYDTGVGIRVRTISPSEGRVTGGEPMTILGSGFPTGASVTIGGNPLTDLKMTDKLITGTTPPGTEGEQDIWIAPPDLDYPILAGKFFYNPVSNVVVTRITPTNGKQAGGDMGTIAGSEFLPGATVTIGDNPATNVGVTPALITFTIPPGTEGAKDVVVTNPDGQKAILRGGYTYNPFPVIEKAEPKYGGPLRGDGGCCGHHW